MSESVFFEF